MTAIATRVRQHGSRLDLLLPVLVVVRWRAALRQFLVRAISRRYRASAFGMLWAVFVPLVTLAVYTFVFGVVMQSRWDTGAASTLPFSLNLFAGLLVFWFMADTLTQAPAAVVEHANLVKRALFPLEIIPVVVVGNALFHTAINTFILLVAVAVMDGHVPATALLFPLVMLPFAIFLTGCAWLVAALGVYFRDLIQLIGLLMTGVLFLSPIFYSIARLPPNLQSWIALNPVSLIVTQSRAVLLEGRLPDWWALAFYFLAACVTASLGLAFFRRTRENFADVL